MTIRCTATTVRGTPCEARPLKGTDRCLAHTKTPEERRDWAKAMRLIPRGRKLLLVEMHGPKDAEANVRVIEAAMAEGRLSERLARAHLLAIKIFIECYQTRSRDFDRELREAEARLRAKYVTTLQRR